jgi:hypothetical protein
LKSSPLLFNWPHRHRIQFLLPATIVIATLAHGSVLFLIGIVHPTPRFDGPNPARVYFLPPESAFHSRIQSLLISSDPALYAPKHGLPTSDIATTATYTPQFEIDKPSLITLPPRLKARDKFSLPTGAVKLPGHAISTPPRQVLKGKSIHLTGDLKNRATENLKQTIELLPLPTDFEPSSFLVGISESGAVIHITPYRSTSDPATDTQLLNIIRSLRFSSTETPGTAWGMIEIHSRTTP